MPGVFSTFDVYALLDADTDEARSFTTYLGYWACLSNHVVDIYGAEPFDGLLAEMHTRRLASLGGSRSGCDRDQLADLLLNAWTSELALHLVELENTERLWLANHSAPVHAYFATSRAASAWQLVRNSVPVESHAALLRAASSDIFVPRPKYPLPWSLCCTALKPKVSYHGFPANPSHVSNLAANADPHDRCAMLLRTTRHREVKRLVEQLKKERHLDRAPNGTYRAKDAGLSATTVFDFMWRARKRSNYGDPAMFYVGTLTPNRSRVFAASVRQFTAATMFVFEAMIAQRARDTLIDSATHFISRDRARLADHVLGPRLRALGLL
jgi:hypothetical protein